MSSISYSLFPLIL